MSIKECRDLRRAKCSATCQAIEMLKSIVLLLGTCTLLAGAEAGGRAKRSLDLEDANLDVPQLIAKYNYPVEVHTVRTSDGYLLEMHRIPRGHDAPADAPLGEPVFVMHGLVSSSADFVITGPSQALGYILADSGYDVWIANARGNYYSRQHTSRNPDRDASFWNFSFDEMGNLDLPASIDYVLAATDRTALHYIGHSQGSTAFLALASLRPEYNAKIKSAQLMAPAATLSGMDAPLFNSLAEYATLLANLGTLFGLNEIFPRGTTFEFVDGEMTCIQSNPLSSVCEALLPFFAGQSTDDSGTDLMPVVVGHTPAGASIKCVAHYGQILSSDRFCRWDHTTFIQNLIAYGAFTPPNYDLSRVSALVFLHYSLGDVLTPLSDVMRLYDSLPNAELWQVASEDFTHFAFAWASSARDTVYADIISIMRRIDAQS